MFGQFINLAVNGKINGQRPPGGNPADKLIQGCRQPQIIQRHGTHIKDDLTHAAQTVTHLLPQLLQCPLGLVRVIIHQLFRNGSLQNKIGQILRRTIVHFPGNAVPFLFLSLDDTRPDKLLFLHGLYLPDNTVYLRAEIGQHRPHGQRQMLCLRQHGLQAPEAQLHLIALGTEIGFLFPFHPERNLHVFYSLIGFPYLFLGVLLKVAADLHQILLFLLFLFGQLVHPFNGNADLLLQLFQQFAAAFNFSAGSFINLKDLGLVIFNCADCIA